MKKKKITYPIYKAIKFVVGHIYPKTEVVGLENIPDGEPVVFVGNHSQMNGPIVCELYLPNRYTWCAGEMMKIKDVPSYAYKDFWSEKPKFLRPFYKVLSYLIAPLSQLVFTNADTVAVYHDARLLSTFRTTINLLCEGSSIVIFPEHNVPHNNILYEFQNRFVDVASMYHKKCGKELLFVPLYIAPKLKKMYIGKPTRYSPSSPLKEERERITAYLSEQITNTARSLPYHTVIPYRNIPKKLYPTNKEEK